MKKVKLILLFLVLSVIFTSCATPLCSTYSHSVDRVPKMAKPINTFQTNTFNGGF